MIEAEVDGIPLRREDGSLRRELVVAMLRRNYEQLYGAVHMTDAVGVPTDIGILIEVLADNGVAQDDYYRKLFESLSARPAPTPPLT